MALYNRDALVANLTKRIEQEKQHDADSQAAYEFELNDWFDNAVARFARAVRDFDPDTDTGLRRYSERYEFSPPSKPNKNDASCSRAEEALARLLLIQVNAKGNVNLGSKDNIIRLGGVNCGH